MGKKEKWNALVSMYTTTEQHLSSTRTKQMKGAKEFSLSGRKQRLQSTDTSLQPASHCVPPLRCPPKGYTWPSHQGSHNLDSLAGNLSPTPGGFSHCLPTDCPPCSLGGCVSTGVNKGRPWQQVLGDMRAPRGPQRLGRPGCETRDQPSSRSTQRLLAPLTSLLCN